MRKKTRNAKWSRWEKRKNRVRGTLESSDRVRLTVFRSARHIYAQLDDPVEGRTLATVSSRSSQVLGDAGSPGGVEAAKKVGAAVAAVARERNIEEVVFNRNGFLYHGRVKALADAAREAGLRF